MPVWHHTAVRALIVAPGQSIHVSLAHCSACAGLFEDIAARCPYHWSGVKMRSTPPAGFKNS